MTNPNCKRCRGTARIRRYDHIDGGICYACNPQPKGRGTCSTCFAQLAVRGACAVCGTEN